MGLLRMAARTAVVAGTATAVSGRVARRQADRVRPAGRRAHASRPSRGAVRRAGSGRSGRRTTQMAKLQELAQLHTQGVLSDEEFAAAKAKILGI